MLEQLIKEGKVGVSSRNIYWTTEYGIFGSISGNRDLNEPKIKRIVKCILEDKIDLLPYCPILVTDKLMIIDGQHRRIVAKLTKRQLYFSIVQDFTIRQIAKINQNTTAWKMKDFLNCYIDIGVYDYKILQQFLEDFPFFGQSFAVRILYYGTSSLGGPSNTTFKDGEFKAKYLEFATDVGNKIKDYSEFKESPVKFRNFQVAIFKLNESDKYSHAEVISKLQRTQPTFEKKDSPTEYIYHIEELFNKGDHKRKPIF